MSPEPAQATASRPGLVIFDCDGVLVDTERLATAIEARTLTAMGHPHTQADVVATFMGRSAADAFTLLTDLLGPARALEFDERSTAETREAFARELAPVPGVVAVLDAVEAAGLRYCVASSGSHARMELTLGTTGLSDRFVGRIHSAEAVDRGKPWPDVFLHAAAREGVDPSGCVVIEDSVNGVLAARAAGMEVLGFAGGLAGAEALRQAGATLFDEMADLPPLLGLYNSRSA
ncbi:HAD family hydrolase [Arthrobacter sp. JSM 101049]|uniref:HAD family hydrolase n=1 Tax=Arthrobacter sp. JSM 101049 TaxID=929097 RepID=UPI0035689648